MSVILNDRNTHGCRCCNGLTVGNDKRKGRRVVKRSEKARWLRFELAANEND